ncbi:vpu protein [Simian immunodeficiency virus]|uniref:Vpu protein n=1 Tax=Simian immunodeficiency virus TaxID=11723 RepID=I3VKV5_SIV|nr:vpu protein [Simian immunodeficiency virus]
MIKVVVGNLEQNVVGVLVIIIVLVGGGALIAWIIIKERNRERQHQRLIERLVRRLSIDSGIEEDEEFQWLNFDPDNHNPRDWI